MRAGQGVSPPLPGALPIVPPIEEDEPISSWLDRTACFYGRPLEALLRGPGRQSRRVELAEVDLGTPRLALVPVAALLGVDVDLQCAHTMSAAYPWATHLVAHRSVVLEGERRPRLRYAACPHCLERQRLERGASRVRRAWVLAPRTVCSTHHVPLVGARMCSIAHPIWAYVLRSHRRSGLAVSTDARGGAYAPGLPIGMAQDDPSSCSEVAAVLHRRMAAMQDGILAMAERAQGRPERAGEERAVVAADLVWAFTRADRHHPDRIVYEAFSSDLLDDPWHLARRRRPGPVDFNTLPMDERHLLLATATLLLYPQGPRHGLGRAPNRLRDDFAILQSRLRDADRAELAERQGRWPAMG